MNRPPRPGMIRRFLLAFGEFAVVLVLFATAWAWLMIGHGFGLN